MEKKKFLFKTLTIGEGGAGKTSLLRRYVEGKFNDSTVLTVGVDFYIKELDFESKAECTLQLWDFSGQIRFRHLLGNYVMGARAALLLVDLTRMPEMEELVEWVNIVRTHDPVLPILLIGTKADLKDLIAVDDGFMLNVMNTFNMAGYIKVSAKTGHNVNKVFKVIAKKLMNQNKY
ncbi:MAG: GTP-binding protein [Candidatus Lokiarchaeota archaeon]|nr:GTP-binding protein [Candidatus Lokiarchaeota archaeon]